MKCPRWAVSGRVLLFPVATRSIALPIAAIPSRAMRAPVSDAGARARSQGRRPRTTTMILVVGATGFVGGMITRTLLQQARPVRILVRRGSDYQPFVDAGAEPSLGDLKDPTSLAAALHGI